jgi:hypothetical protein
MPARTAFQQALQIYRDTGDRHGEEIALNNLQETRQAQEDEPRAPLKWAQWRGYL